MQLNLKDATFQELFTHSGLALLDRRFIEYLDGVDSDAVVLLNHYRAGCISDAKNISACILQLAPHLNDFIAELFSISQELVAAQAKIMAQDPIFVFKEYFVLKKARRMLSKIAEIPCFEVLNQSMDAIVPHRDTADYELILAQAAVTWLADESAFQAENELLCSWCAQALYSREGQAFVASWSSFKLPKKLDFKHLVNLDPVAEDELNRQQAPRSSWRYRQGFELTDRRMSQREVLSEIDYCVYCHEKESDFCSKGFPVKKGKPELGLKVSPLNNDLTGCPLEEKISEMHQLKKQGWCIGALATVMIDNPMCPATGHRICNDCMNACIYQKQDPVNIPEVETRVLSDVLELPWGVEIYDLLTRWNPLRQQQYLLKPYNGRKVLVMGMGPAGFTLAHHLLMEGYAVVGADGLKLEPLPRDLLDQPIYSYNDLEESLAERVMAGFGGVAEYGITVRWDKNFLKLILISLLRKSHFQVFGSMRFGGTLTVEDAWDLGFDHLAVAVGAGLPRELRIPNSLAPGMRQANDFLMALQLTGAAKASSLANLQIRLPAVVIGGGLTGVDAATELQAYYIVQVEKIHYRYQALVEKHGVDALRARFVDTDLDILDEYLRHAELIAKERARANSVAENPDFIRLLHQWGGVTIVYRRSMQESPAYRKNPEELAKAMEEGLYYSQAFSPFKVLLDETGAVKALECKQQCQNEEGQWVATDHIQRFPARCILVATGAKPNVAYEFEHEGTFARERFEYKRFDYTDGDLIKNTQQSHVKMDAVGAFTSYDNNGRYVSFLGDTHPVFHGSVVNAIASAKRIYPEIVSVMPPSKPDANDLEYQQFHDKLEFLFKAYVKKITWRGSIFELDVTAPMAATKFKAGQFYRLQSYETLVSQKHNTSLQAEAVAVIGIPVADDDTALRFLIQPTGVSSQLMQNFKEGERLSVMGPTGVAAIMPENATVIVIGGYNALAHILSIGPTLTENNCNIVFITELIQEQLEHFSDLPPLCQQIVSVVTEISTCVFSEILADVSMDLKTVTQVVVVGSSALIKSVQKQRSQLAYYLPEDVAYIAAVHGPMQCMLKGVCAQCLQWQIDPVTKQRTKAVFACSWHNQPMELIDTGNIDERLAQNRLQETLTRCWYEHIQSH